MITEKEKCIYNSFLVAGRKSKNKPFKLRKNFTNLDPEIYVLLKKLDGLFKRNPNINMDVYFEAPYFVYDKDSHFDLRFYTTRRSLKCYTNYLRQREQQNPDSAEVVDRCKKCCAFIYNYCVERGITLDEYKTLSESNIPITLQHLKEHKINFYTLHGLGCSKKIQEIGTDLLDFLVPDYNIIINDTRVNFLKSTRLKDVVSKSFLLIEKKLKTKKLKN